jgi:hypothetical protein
MGQTRKTILFNKLYTYAASDVQGGERSGSDYQSVQLSNLVDYWTVGESEVLEGFIVVLFLIHFLLLHHFFPCSLDLRLFPPHPIHQSSSLRMRLRFPDFSHGSWQHCRHQTLRINACHLFLVGRADSKIR